MQDLQSQEKKVSRQLQQLKNYDSEVAKQMEHVKQQELEKERQEVGELYNSMHGGILLFTVNMVSSETVINLVDMSGRMLQFPKVCLHLMDILGLGAFTTACTWHIYFFRLSSFYTRLRGVKISLT